MNENPKIMKVRPYNMKQLVNFYGFQKLGLPKNYVLSEED